MPIFDKVSEKMKQAMKAGEKRKLAALRSIRAAFLNRMKEDASESVSDQDCITLLRRLAKQGQVLFLLDGADEVPAGERAAIWKALAALDKGAYGGNRWVATCRVLSFDREEAPAGVPVQTLQALDEAQIPDVEQADGSQV